MVIPMLFSKNSMIRMAVYSSLALAGVQTACAQAADRKPNIILISTKEFAGSRKNATPSIDALGQSGADFTSGYAVASLAGPANGGLLTGRYPQRFGFDANAEGDPDPSDHGPRGLDLAQVTLAQRLKASGYVTGVFGDWYLGAVDGYRPNQRGFDEFYGTLSPAKRASIYRNTEVDTSIDNPLVHFDRFESEALSFIDRHASDPFFAYIPVTGQPARLDELVKQIVTKLHDRGLDQNTLIVFLDNHTEQWQLSESAVRSRIIFSWKGTIPAGETVTDPVSELDVAPTTLAAAGVEISPDWHLDGTSLLPLLEGTTKAAPQENLYWRFGVQYAVRQGDWRLVKAVGNEPARLFHITDDPTEKQDLLASNQYQAKSLQSQWDAWNKANEQPRWIDWNGITTEASDDSDDAPASVGSDGPWNSGDSVTGKRAPDVAGRPLEISANIDVTGNNGVIVSQGGLNQGFAIYLSEGKLSFAVRENKELTTIASNDTLGSGHFSVKATLASDGTLTLGVNGKQVALGKASGLIPQQPKAGLSVGNSDFGSVGDYDSPNPFAGKVADVRIKALAAK
jgi:arylsulfatase A-like enzyme